MARKGQSAAFLRSLRRKYRLGEYSGTKRRRPRLRKGPKPRRGLRKAVRKASGGYGTVLRYAPGTLGYPGTSAKENFYRQLGVPDLGFDEK